MSLDIFLKPINKMKNRNTGNTNNTSSGSSSNLNYNSISRSSQSSSSWLDLYKPSTSKDLVIHSTKVRDLTNWLKEALKHHHIYNTSSSSGGNDSSNNDSDDDDDERAQREQILRDFKPYVLVLAGRSGVGKSSSVEVLCKELDISVREWNEEMYETNSGSSGSSSSMSSGMSGGGSSMVDKFEEFAVQSRYAPLSLSSSSGSSGSGSDGRGSGKSKSVSNKKQRISSNSGISAGSGSDRHIVLMHDPPTTTTTTSSSNSNTLHLTQLLSSFGAPLIIIASNCGERDNFKYTAESVLPVNVRSGVEFR